MARYFIQMIVCLAACLISFSFVSGAAMTSTNYQIEFDALNLSGGYSTSVNYIQENTMGQAASGYATSATYELYAGYQQNPGIYLSVTPANNLTLDTLISYSAGGSSNGSVSLNVKTDNPSGYTLYLKSASNPALQCSSGCSVGVDHFDNYAPVGANPDFTWSLSGSSGFGYTVEGADTAAKFLDNGTDCNTGSGNVADKCWWYPQTANLAIASSASANHPNGAATTIKFRAQSGAMAQGNYVAQLIFTIVSN